MAEFLDVLLRNNPLGLLAGDQVVPNPRTGERKANLLDQLVTMRDRTDETRVVIDQIGQDRRFTAARAKLEAEIMKMVDGHLGAVARPSRVHFVSTLPKTRSGKLLRRALQAVAERRDTGDLTTMEDPVALQQIKDLMG